MANDQDIQRIMQEAQKALDMAIATEKNNKRFVASIGPAIVEVLKDTLVETVQNLQKPILEKMADMMEENMRTNQNDLRDALKNIHVNVEPNITVPEVKVPEVKVNVPKPEVTVKVPKNNEVISAINEMTKAFSEQRPIDLEMPRYTMKEPMPVLITDAKGEPWSPFGGGGGHSRVIQFMDGDTPRAISSANPLPTTASLSLGGSSIEVKQVSGFTNSVNVVDAFGSTSVNSVFNADNRLRVSVETGGSGLTNSELRASGVEVKQVSGFTDSVNVVGFTASVAVNISDSSGVGYSGSNPVPVGTVQSFEVKQVSGFTDSIFVTGSADSMLAYQARTTNPTAVSDGADIRPTTDDLGRQLIRPMQVRDLISTAYATLSTGSETTLLSAAGAGIFSDLIYIMASNTSNAAVQVDIRSVTGGNVEFTIEVPASGTAGKSLPVPWPQANANNNWTADMGDFTNTTVYVSALFSKEV